SGYRSAYLAHNPYCLNLLLIYLGSGSGTKNSAAERSGMPISHKVGPSLGGLYTRLPRSM
ncbi:unnamed protein product, partial [Musa acuminata subsp. burmannicoides]